MIGTVMAMVMAMEMEVQVQARAWVVVRAALTSPQVAAMCGEVAAVAAGVVQVAGAVEVAKVGLGLGSAAAEAAPPVGAREDQWTQVCVPSTGVCLPPGGVVPLRALVHGPFLGLRCAPSYNVVRSLSSRLCDPLHPLHKQLPNPLLFWTSTDPLTKTWST